MDDAVLRRLRRIGEHGRVRWTPTGWLLSGGSSCVAGDLDTLCVMSISESLNKCGMMDLGLSSIDHAFWREVKVAVD